MDGTEPQFLDLGPQRGTPQGAPRKIAFRYDEGSADAPAGILWLSGFLSDMASTKVSALAEWAAAKDLPMMRFDYSGHGVSSGKVADGAMGDWLEESIAISERMGDRPILLVGSSMGGWLSLLLARHLIETGKGDRLAGIVLIAPAWDMTESLMWHRFTDEIRREIEEKGIYYQPSLYGDPYPLSKLLIEEGRTHLLAGSRFDPKCPVRILQGMEDPDVPWRHALALVEILAGGDVELDLIKDADHRLSRPQDIARLTRTIEGVLEEIA
ncbi:alpha/beta hydrolase [Methyloligella sp. 2.7D]|uniref:alpha/beta hydrolase n=1 Tax=unclassified Methyloligella TaxID=2625955 RepID=UPI00157BE2AD|nr:alpha/beta hydrolase [Methyloligella sp. GL2]QKP76082.1 alpha/beta hydrolase [Methyloligella sp. GL2]